MAVALVPVVMLILVQRGFVLAGLPLSQIDGVKQAMIPDLAGQGLILCFSLGLAWWFSSMVITRRVDILAATAARLAGGVVRSLIVRSLDLYGYKVLEARNGGE